MLVLQEMNALVQPYYEECHIAESYQTICEEVGEEYSICPELLEALIERESSGRKDAENGSCKGLCQISEKWHKNRMAELGISDIYDPESNIRLCADYLIELGAEYQDIGLVLMCYHGESDAKAKAERGELSEYAEWILTRSEELERANGK